MVEMFIFLRGHGVLRMDGNNYSIGKDTFATVYPPTRHTIFNDADAEDPLSLLTIAAVP